MADGTQLNAGSGGDILATDEIASGTLAFTTKYQVVKVAYGALDSETWVSASAGLPVAQQGTWNITNVSGTVSLPTGAATAAKQPALGTSGSASSDVISVQGPGPGMTPLLIQGGNSNAVKVDGTGGSFPISGTVSITANSAVNVAQVAGTAADTNSGVKSAGTLRVVLATDQPALTNALKVDPSGVTSPVSGTVTVTQTTASNLKVDLSGTAANATAIKVDPSAVTSPITGTVTANLKPTTSGGLSIGGFRVSANTVNNTVVKNSAGQVYSMIAWNTNAAARYLKTYDATIATAGTTTPKMTILIPPNSSGVVMTVENGIQHSTGICCAVTTGATDGDTGAVATNEVGVTIAYL